MIMNNSHVGFAFVLMDDPRDAEDAVRELDGKRICGRRVKVHDIACWIITPELVESEKSST